MIFCLVCCRGFSRVVSMFSSLNLWSGKVCWFCWLGTHLSPLMVSCSEHVRWLVTLGFRFLSIDQRRRIGCAYHTRHALVASGLFEQSQVELNRTLMAPQLLLCMPPNHSSREAFVIPRVDQAIDKKIHTSGVCNKSEANSSLHPLKSNTQLFFRS